MSPPSMMIPRAYSYKAEKKKSRASSPKSWTDSDASPRSRTRRNDTRVDSRNAAARQKMTPSGSSDSSLAGGIKTEPKSGKPKRLTSISHSTPSAPVVIPTRTASPKKGRSEQPKPVDQHDPQSLSPSMAALLAMTSIPRSRARAIKRSDRDRLSPVDFRQSVSSTSPHSWSILQSPPNELRNVLDKDPAFDIEVGSVTSHGTLDVDRAAMYRSLSSDSIPSLDIENEMFNSPESPPMPRTPSSRRARSPRREKIKMTAIAEPLAAGEVDPLRSNDDGLQSRPASGAGVEMDDKTKAVDTIEPRRPSQTGSAPSQFRSNLTASLYRLKTVARSITLPTPSVSTVLAINSRVLPRRVAPPRPRSPLPMMNSAFSQQTLSHMIVKGSKTQPLAAELYFSSTPSEEYRPITSSIQMQPYMRRGSDDDLDKATAPPIFISSTPAPPILLPGIDSPRPREPRENSDFLRVVVLEMNMRRAGKLGDVGGRARIWLGPRPEKAGQEPKIVEPTPKVARAERGMGEAVALELAEAMMIDGSEATLAKSMQCDDGSHSFDAEALPQDTNRRQTHPYAQGDVPLRWQSMTV